MGTKANPRALGVPHEFSSSRARSAEKEPPRAEALLESIGPGNRLAAEVETVSKLFAEEIEFDSKSHLARRLNGSVGPEDLDAILSLLISENRILKNSDSSLTWIDSKGNKELNALFDRAVRI